MNVFAAFLDCLELSLHNQGKLLSHKPKKKSCLEEVDYIKNPWTLRRVEVLADLMSDVNRSTNPGTIKNETKTRKCQEEPHEEQSNEEDSAMRNCTAGVCMGDRRRNRIIS